MTGTLAVIDTAALAGPTAAHEVAAAWLLGFGSASTREAYRRDFDQWAEFVGGLGVAVFDARRGHVEAYARSLEAAGRTRATVARKLAALSSFYAYALDEEVIERSPVKVRRPKLDGDSQQLGLDRDEVRRLLAAGRASGPRDAALVMLLAMNGLRISEALAATVADLSSARGHRTLTITRKGGKRALVPLAPAVGEAIDRMLNMRGDHEAPPDR